MSIFEAIVFGLIQGLTEFLPVSSSGHLALFKHLFHVDFDKFGMSFDVALHLATIIAVMVVLWKDIWALLKKPFQKTTLYLIVATIPAAVIGVLFNDAVASVSETLWVVGVCFLVTGVVLFVSDKMSRGDQSKKRTMEEMRMRDAISAGVAQAVGVLPGVSRSGSTISGGLISGMNRDGATRFSFLMSIPIILGSCLFDLKDIITGEVAVDSTVLVPTLVGMVVAGISGYLACRFMLNYIRKKGMKIFVYYMLFIGVFAIVWDLFLSKLVA